MDPSAQSQVAEELLGAYASGKPVAPLSETYPGLTFEDAYTIQRLQVESWTAQGRAVRGHKVGLTNARVQAQLGVDQPDYGHLMDDFFHLEHTPIPISRFIQPKIEPEIAFVLRRPLHGPGVTVPEAIDAVEYVLPSLEIVDSRIEDWKIGILDTISDNASSGAVVLGSTPTPLGAVDLRLTGVTIHRNGELAATGAGGAVLGSPLSSLVWLANTLGSLGVTLEAGQVVLPGAATPMVAVAEGDTFTARFAGLGSVTAVFSRETS